MKKTLLVGLAIGLVSAAATAVFAGPSPRMAMPTQGYTGAKNVGATGIVGSSHDLSNAAGKAAGGASNTAATFVGTAANEKDAQSRICVFCHHPHNAEAASSSTQGGGISGTKTFAGDYSPLWNRAMSQTVFKGYSNGTMMTNSAVLGSDKRHVLNAGNTTAIKGVSLLCMSCHDGVVAMNAYSQGTGSDLGKGANTKLDTGNVLTSKGFITSSAGFKGDMNNHHPMGFKYAAVQALDAEIASTTTVMVPTNLGALTSGNVEPIGNVTIGSLLYGNSATDATFECVTCHDVHNTANTPDAERFLWRSNNKSNFCLVCHLK